MECSPSIRPSRGDGASSVSRLGPGRGLGLGVNATAFSRCNEDFEKS